MEKPQILATNLVQTRFVQRLLYSCPGLCGKRLELCGHHCTQILVSCLINVKVRPDDCNCLLAESRDTTAGPRKNGGKTEVYTNHIQVSRCL